MHIRFCSLKEMTWCISFAIKETRRPLILSYSEVSAFVLLRRLTSREYNFFATEIGYFLSCITRNMYRVMAEEQVTEWTCESVGTSHDRCTVFSCDASKTDRGAGGKGSVSIYGITKLAKTFLDVRTSCGSCCISVRLCYSSKTDPRI